MTVKKISAAEVVNLIASGGQFLLIDIRSASYYAQGHIEGAISMPADAFNPEAIPNWVEKTTPIVVYCYHGVLSLQAAQYLQSIGYEDVRSMEGGFAAWR